MNTDEDFPLIMNQYPGLKALPWMKIANLPTPVMKLEGLEKELDFTGIYMKRDDLSNEHYGGNKVRKFEYVLADVLRKERANLITLGGIGTNHGLAQSIFCKYYTNENVKSIVYVFDQPLTEHCRYNMLLDYHYGAEIKYRGGLKKAILSILLYYLTHRKSYFLWPGASIPLGTIGFVNAAFELKKQINDGVFPEPDFLFVADGSTGTSAGLTLGCELAGLKTKIFAVAVSILSLTNKNQVVKLAYNTYKLLKKHDENIPLMTKDKLNKRLDVLTDFFGGEYGLPTQEGKEAVEMIKKSDNITLDLTYTGKTCSAMIAFIREKKDDIKGKSVLFWNTLNSVDHHNEASKINYHDLPKDIHKLFDGSIELESRYVKARQIGKDL